MNLQEIINWLDEEVGVCDDEIEKTRNILGDETAMHFSGITTQKQASERIHQICTKRDAIHDAIDLLVNVKGI